MLDYRFTIADLERMPEDGKRYEVIDGELHVTAAPHADHQASVDQLTFALRSWDPGQERGLALSGVGVIFSLDSGVIPDLVWVASDRLAAVFLTADGARDGKLHAAPDLIVEVLSPGLQNEERDRETKRKLYSRQGVKEYWIADRQREVVQVQRRGEAAVLELALTLSVADTLTSPMLPGFALPVAQIFTLPALFREARR